MNWALFVEGSSDQAFIRWLLKVMQIATVRVRTIGGGVSKLENVQNEILKSHDKGDLVALLLDANSDVQGRRDELENEIKRLNLPIERTFLLPDDTAEGDLETLLEQMAPAAHREVYRCFDAYEACLRRLRPEYKIPNRKARVYAYCEAIGAETGTDKDYDDATHWNPEAPALAPLRTFLRDLRPSAANPETDQ